MYYKSYQPDLRMLALGYIYKLYIIICVGGSSKIQTLSHDSSSIKILQQWKDSQIIKVDFLHLQMCRYNTYYYPVAHDSMNIMNFT